MDEEPGPSAPGPAAGEVRSVDGTAIGYQRVGAGPAVVLLHGAGQSSANLMRLAAALSATFTVYVPDRRGRGRSGPYGEFRGLDTEIEDLSALLDACGASRLFGLSAGAVIAIEASRRRPGITRLALYEPPLSFDGVVHGDWAPRYERQLAAGRPGAALVTVLKATADRTSPVRWIPARPLGAVLATRLSPAELPPPPGQRPARPLWCGECDERTRMIGFYDDAPRPCSRCRPAPSRRNWIPRRTEELPAGPPSAETAVLGTPRLAHCQAR